MSPQSDLQFNNDETFQRVEWLSQRIGWGLWFAVLVAASVGLLGPGWLSDCHLTTADGTLTLRYERFLHHHNPSHFEVSFAHPPNAAGRWTLDIGQPLLDSMQILRIEPEPILQEIRSDGASYTFESARDATAGRAVFHVEYEQYGRVEGSIALDESSPLTFTQFVYP